MKQILVIEDEIFTANFISNSLSKIGLCTIANNYEKSIYLLDNNNFDLILIDVNLNEIKTGIDIARYISTNLETPFLFLTSYSNQITLQEAASTRPQGYLVKPIKSEDIIASVTIALNNNYHKKLNTSQNIVENIQSSYKIKRVINYINENIDKKIEIDELSKITKWKTHHLIRVFTSYINKTPYQYLLKLKIEKSKALLLESDMPLNQISFELGFKSYSNFWNAFQKANGISPNEYRKSNKKN